MPHVMRTFEDWNARLSTEAVEREGAADDLPRGEYANLLEYLREMGVHIEGPGVEKIMGLWPAAEVAAIQSATENAVRRGIPVSVSWMPGYDTEVTIKEWRDWEATEPCGLTILLRSRHASDTKEFRSAEKSS